MPNFHNNEGDTPNFDSLHLFIVAEQATSATLNIWNIYEENEVHTFNIAAGEPFQFRKFYDDYEPATGSNLAGKRRNGVVNSGRPQLVSWHLKTDEKVGAIILNNAAFTSDAAMLFPYESLGQNYIVTTYNSDIGSGSNQETLSQFLIVATEDNTEIEINYSENTISESETIFLDKHQIFLSNDRFPNFNDQSGTEIRADKPIAVFGGHERAKVPFSGNNNSRDHLIEQMPPIETWSNEYYVVNFLKEFEGRDDLFRIVAALDNTQIQSDGIPLVTLNKGEVYTADIDRPTYITADAPILVSQIKKSSSSGSGARNSADPFLVIVPPQDNFHTNFSFVSIEAMNMPANNFGLDPVQKFSDHYLTIIAADTHPGFVNIDGINVPLDFEPIFGTDHQFASLEVQPGPHTLISQDKIGLYVYGYGSVDSYGYLGGMSFEEFDLFKPTLSYQENCNQASGTFTDSLSFKGQIELIELLNDDNVELNLNGNEFALSLIDDTQDGSGIVRAVDNDGLFNQTELIELNGFTFDIKNIEEDEITQEAVIGQRICKNFTIINYSEKAKVINNLNIEGNFIELSSSEDLPTQLESGEEIEIEICFEPESKGEFYTNILIDDGCYNKKILQLKQIYEIDERSPRLFVDSEDCPGTFEVFMEELRRFDIGIDRVEIIREDNIERIELNVNDTTAFFQGRVIDRTQDAAFSLEVYDKSGNLSEYNRDFPGFTVRYINQDQFSEPVVSEFNEKFCFEVEMENYGGHEKVFDRVYFEENFDFSLPASQLPVILAPGETKLIPICFSKTEGNLSKDTLILETECDKLVLPLSGEIIYSDYGSGSRCRLTVGYTNVENLDEFIGPISPNPVGDILSTFANISSDGTININIMDASGKILISENLSAKKGINRVDIQVSDLQMGFYQLIILGENGTHLEEKFIKRE